MSNPSVNNEWSRLNEVVLGIASDLYWPRGNTVVNKETSSLWLVALERIGGTVLAGKKVPNWITGKFRHELELLENVLLKLGVTVHRPVPIEPRPGDEPGLSQLFARDPIIAIGRTLILARQRLALLRKEIRGFTNIIGVAEALGYRVVQVPDQPDDIFLEGGDVLVDLPYVYVGIGELASNAKGAQWLQDELGPEVKVVPVPIRKPGIFHLDTCLALIGPKLGFICREALVMPLPYPLHEYEFIEVDEKTRKGIGTNVLVVAPETVIVQARHLSLQRALQQRGVRVIPLCFNWHALSGGAFRCATHPLCRS